MTTKVWHSGAWVDLAGAGGVASDQYPSPHLIDRVNLAASERTNLALTANATPFADGTWTELDASLSADCSGLFIFITNAVSAGDTNTSTLLEIGTGTGGAEALWARFQVGYAAGSSQYYLPGFIPAGTRVAVRPRSAVASQAVNGFYTFMAANKSVNLSAPVTMGDSASTCRGVSLGSPGSLNTKSAWQEIVASTSQEFNVLMLSPGHDGDTTGANAGALIDIGIGASTLETVLIENHFVSVTSSETMQARSPATYGVNVPAGSRLSARWQRPNAGISMDLIIVGA